VQHSIGHDHETCMYGLRGDVRNVEATNRVEGQDLFTSGLLTAAATYAAIDVAACHYLKQTTVQGSACIS
jgi:hypothetical protein